MISRVFSLKSKPCRLAVFTLIKLAFLTQLSLISFEKVRLILKHFMVSFLASLWGCLFVCFLLSRLQPELALSLRSI